RDANEMDGEVERMLMPLPPVAEPLEQEAPNPGEDAKQERLGRLLCLSHAAKLNEIEETNKRAAAPSRDKRTEACVLCGVRPGERNLPDLSFRAGFPRETISRNCISPKVLPEFITLVRG